MNLLLFLLPILAHAGDPMVCHGTKGEKNWDRLCTAESAQAIAEPDADFKTPAQCARHAGKALNTRCQWFPVEDRHVAGLIAEFFHARLKDEREFALNYLEHFCKTASLCAPHFTQLDREVKAHKQTMPAGLGKRASALRDSLSP